MNYDNPHDGNAIRVARERNPELDAEIARAERAWLEKKSSANAAKREFRRLKNKRVAEWNKALREIDPKARPFEGGR